MAALSVVLIDNHHVMRVGAHQVIQLPILHKPVNRGGGELILHLVPEEQCVVFLTGPECDLHPLDLLGIHTHAALLAVLQADERGMTAQHRGQLLHRPALRRLIGIPHLHRPDHLDVRLVELRQIGIGLRINAGAVIAVEFEAVVAHNHGGKGPDILRNGLPHPLHVSDRREVGIRLPGQPRKKGKQRVLCVDDHAGIVGRVALTYRGHGSAHIRLRELRRRHALNA